MKLIPARIQIRFTFHPIENAIQLQYRILFIISIEELVSSSSLIFYPYIQEYTTWPPPLWAPSTGANIPSYSSSILYPRSRNSSGNRFWQSRILTSTSRTLYLLPVPFIPFYMTSFHMSSPTISTTIISTLDFRISNIPFHVIIKSSSAAFSPLISPSSKAEREWASAIGLEYRILGILTYPVDRP